MHDASILFRCCMEALPLLNNRSNGDEDDSGVDYVGVHPIYLILYEIFENLLQDLSYGKSFNESSWSARLLSLGSHVNNKGDFTSQQSDPKINFIGEKVIKTNTMDEFVQIEATLVCIMRPSLHSVSTKFIQRVRNIHTVPEKTEWMSASMYSLKEIESNLIELLEGRIVNKGCFIILESSCTKLNDSCFDTREVLYPYGRVSQTSDLSDGSDYFVLHITNISRSICKESSNEIFRLGSKKTFSLSLDVRQINDSTARGEELGLKSHSDSNDRKSLYMKEPPGYSVLYKELIELATINNTKASVAGVLLLGCAGVGKSTMVSEP